MGDGQRRLDTVYNMGPAWEVGSEWLREGSLAQDLHEGSRQRRIRHVNFGKSRSLNAPLQYSQQAARP